MVLLYCDCLVDVTVDSGSWLGCAAAAGAAASHTDAQQHSLAELHAPEAAYELKPAPAAARKKGAIIGSAPQLSSEGLMAAARLAQAKELHRKMQVRSIALCCSHVAVMCKMTIK